MDQILVGFGVVLTLVGIALFARTKVTGNNAMKLLGMEVQVSHPSLFIFFSGIVLILVPRLLPAQQQPLPPAAEQGDPTAEPPAQPGEPEPEPGAPEPEPEPEPEPAADCDPDLPKRLEVENFDQYMAGLGKVLEAGCEGSTYAVGNEALDLGFALQLRERFEQDGKSCRAYADPELSDAPREFACQIAGRWEVVEGEPFAGDDEDFE